MPSLAEFQRDFAASLLAPSLPAEMEMPPGLRVHRNTFMKGAIDALLANFPTVGVLMGREWLIEAACGYARRYPPPEAALTDYGGQFPTYLSDFDEAESCPCLPGVARLDRAWTECLHAADMPSLKPDRLAALSPDALAGMKLRLHPAARFATVAHSAATVWQANHPPATPPAELCIEDQDEAVLIVRNDSGVQFLTLDAATGILLEALVAGRSVGAAACDALLAAPHGDVSDGWSMLLTHGAFSDLDSKRE